MLDLTAFETALGDDVLLTSVMAVNNEVGAISRPTDNLCIAVVPEHPISL